MDDLYALFEWFEATTIGTVVRESLWLFPVIECFHLLALALMGWRGRRRWGAARESAGS